MGTFGVEEHENDDFLDFVDDNTTPSHLTNLLKGFVPGNKVVGILNNLSATQRKNVADNVIQKGIRYLEGVNPKAAKSDKRSD